MYTTIENEGKINNIKATITGIELTIGSIEEVYMGKFCAFVAGIGQISPSKGLLFDDFELARNEIVNVFKREYDL